MISRVGQGVFSFLRRYEWPLVAIWGLGAFLLGFLGFWEQWAGELSFSDAVYRDLQLLFLEGVRESVPWEIEVARLAVPLVAGYVTLKGLLAIFREQVGMLGVRVIPHRVVICGLGERGFLIARSQRERGERVVVIEKDMNNELIEPCRRTGAVVLLGDATDLEVLRRARVHHVYSFSTYETGQVGASSGWR